jgi:hypothetical protein
MTQQLLTKQFRPRTAVLLSGIILSLLSLLSVLVLGLSACGTEPAVVGKFTLHERIGTSVTIRGNKPVTSNFSRYAQETATAHCNADEALVGGGYAMPVLPDQTSARRRVVASSPRATLTSTDTGSWTVIMGAIDLKSDESIYFSAYAECLSGPGLSAASTVITPLADGAYILPDDSTEVRTQSLYASCPDNTILTGGGFNTYLAPGRARIEESYPITPDVTDRSGWKVTFHVDPYTNSVPYEYQIENGYPTGGAPYKAFWANAVCLPTTIGLRAGTVQTLLTGSINLTDTMPICESRDAKTGLRYCTWIGETDSGAFVTCESGQLATSGGFSLYSAAGFIFYDFGVPAPGEVAMTLSHAGTPGKSWYVYAWHTYSASVDDTTYDKLTATPPTRAIGGTPFRVWTVCLQPPS